MRWHLYSAGLLLYGLGMVALGVIILVQGNVVLTYAALIGGIVICAHAIHCFINYFSKNGNNQPKHDNSALITGIFNLAAGIIVMILPDLTMFLLIKIFALYVLLNAAVKLIDFVIARKNHVSGRVYDFIAFIFFLAFGVILLFTNELNKKAFLILAGVYCIAYGVSQLNDFVVKIIPQRTKNRFRRRIRVSVPVFISTFMPLSFMKKINSMLDEKMDRTEAINSFEKELDSKNDGLPPDIEVLIHVSGDGVGTFGHCDLCFEGEIISYGNYDEESYKLARGLGDGIFFTCEKKRYIRFSVTHDHKTIFCYGLRLTPEQKERVRKEIQKIKDSVFPWQPPYEKALAEGKDAKLADFPDYCSKLWNGTRSHFYKFYDGKFKTYFVCSTNCVLLADSILGKTGSDIVKIDGLIAPGTYFDYMQREYLMKDSFVISRTIYNKDNTERLPDEDSWYVDGKGKNGKDRID